MQHVLVESGLRGRSYGRQREHQYDVPADTMVFVKRLRVVDAAEQARNVVLRDADQGLDEEEDVDDQAKDVMGRSEMSTVVGKFVIFNDNESA